MEKKSQRKKLGVENTYLITLQQIWSESVLSRTFPNEVFHSLKLPKTPKILLWQIQRLIWVLVTYIPSNTCQNWSYLPLKIWWLSLQNTIFHFSWLLCWLLFNSLCCVPPWLLDGECSRALAYHFISPYLFCRWSHTLVCFNYHVFTDDSAFSL